MGCLTIVRASAGSGKTYRLACEYVKRALASDDGYRRILAVTFTNKATEEMKRRIMRELDHLAAGETPDGHPPAFADEIRRELGISDRELKTRARSLRTRILHDYSRFTVLTIDKFFQRIIRAFVRELGAENDFTLELQTDPILARAADRLIEQTLADDDLRRWIGLYIEEQLDQGRKWDIRQELTALGKEIFSENYRPAELPARTREQLQTIVRHAVGQVEKAGNRMASIAGEALRIIEAEGLAREDFAYGRNGFVNYFYTVASGEAWGGYGKRVADALQHDNRWGSKTSPRNADIQALVPHLRPLLADICALYDQNRSFAHTTALLRENFRACALLDDLAEYVRQGCQEHNVMLISQTNHIIRRLIDGNDAPFIFEKAGNHFSHFMIDEFQDTSGTQWDNFRPLLANALAQSADSPALLVGDVKQSIYRWRGGDWRILGEQAARAFAQVEQLTLDSNYRSLGNIVRFNNELIGSAVQTADAELNELLRSADGLPDEARGRLDGMLLRAYTDVRQTARPEWSGQGFVRWTQFDPQQQGARQKCLVETIEDLQRRGFRAADIAVLVRYNAEAAAVADHLLDYKSAHAGSPFCYDVVTQQALTIGRAPAVRFVAACFRLAIDPRDSIARALFLKTLGRPAAVELTEHDRAILGSLRGLSLEEAFERILLEYHPDRQRGSAAYLQAFHDQLLAFSQSRIADIPLFLQWWAETGAGESIHLPQGQNAISILTIHKAKGLEFPAVILPGAGWEMDPDPRTLLWAQAGQAPFDRLGPMPVRYRKTMAGSGFAADYYRELACTRLDNLNLLYVALTRAVQELHLITPHVAEPKGGRVHELLLRSIRTEQAAVFAGDYRGTAASEAPHTVYEWGEPIRRSGTSGEMLQTPPPAPQGYPAFRFEGRLRLQRQTERYRGEDGGWQLSPRQYGRLMHRVFESVATRAEIAPALEHLRAEGALSAQDSGRVAERIAAALADPLVGSWFDGSWEVVRNESELIVPARSAGIRRPDRVMIRPDRVVVVDYKFGERQSATHLRQVEEYASLIRRMGYSSVEGYVWYVLQGQVVPVGG